MTTQKRRGRPPSGGRQPGIHIRLPKELLAQVDAYDAEAGLPGYSDDRNRSRAIRDLIIVGLCAPALNTTQLEMVAEVEGVTLEDAAELLQALGYNSYVRSKSAKKRRPPGQTAPDHDPSSI